MANFNFISDPGHSWLEVPMELVDRLGLRNKISQYSYKSKIDGVEKAYLEEDFDAGLFIRAYGEDNVILIYVHLNEESEIRNFKRFK